MIHSVKKPVLVLFLLTYFTVTCNAEDKSIQLGLRYLKQSGERWIENRECVSCHQVPSMIWAHTAAFSSGFEVSREDLAKWVEWSSQVSHFVKASQREEQDRQKTMSGNIDTMVALLLAIPAKNDDGDQWRSEFAKKLVAEQAADGSWKACGQLPMQRRPKDETQAVTTIWTSLALEIEGVSYDRNSALAFADQIESPVSSEWLAARLLLADYQNDSRKQDLQTKLLEQQNPDGGWGWALTEESDALGTGYVLYALAKVAADPDAIQRARDYLVETQKENGKWLVPGTKESAKGKTTATANDWGTAWAIVALAESR
ncbi:terpene cyclase/mutase family protein [Stieleria sp. JC731]|uniref:prenyltransferase/squalene oxidase repeat-containing protein n=1 Tax=Pirellulaceae TaxID=2691357 RepID=UPI001E36279A|nr:prenyltransferase/squalene oxidase repeat-containing protein [Stieleria sp. JC731]MCC9602137.1 terpene cyclase/mutase family protein [Stieleria sp. JC731]